jgi:tetratricopeptide (TPR) repeat protein
MRSNVEELHSRASGHYLKGDFAAATATWRQVLEFQPADERAREGIRLCEQLIGGVEHVPVAAGAGRGTAPDPADEALPSAGATVTAPAPPRPAVASPAGLRLDDIATAADLASAESQLQRRTATLLEEARQLAAAGDDDAARRTLDRVLILDEENAEALALQASLPSADEAAPHVPDEAVDEAEPDPKPETAAGPAAGAAILAMPPRSSVLPQPTRAEPGLEAEAAARAVESASPSPGAAERPGGGLRALASLPWRRLVPAAPRSIFDRRVQLAAAAGATLLLAWGGLRLLGGGDADPAADAPRPARTGAGPAAASGSANAAPPPASGAPAVPAAPIADALLREAEAKFQAGDYAAAVIDYDRVLDLEPERAGVRERLAVAAERYKAQLAEDERWARLTQEFEQGNYADALHLLYRTPAGRPGVDLERAKVNGWYNLGVNALQASDCPRAIGHFEEAQALGPNDAGVIAGLELAEACEGKEVQEQIRRLALRRLTD